MMPTIRSPLCIGIMGLGVGERHAAVYAQRPDYELVAFCGIDSARLA